MTTYTPANESFLNIENNIIQEAIKNGILEQIGYHVSSKGNENIYYSILGSNDVLMQVQEGLYCIINRTVYCASKGKTINLVQELLKFSWRSDQTGANRCHIVAGTPVVLKAAGHTDLLYLTRVLAALEYYGDIKYLDRDYDVHHKGDCWDNRNDLIMYIPRSMHKHRNNHMTGYRLRDVKGFDYLIYNLADKYARLSRVTTVA